MTRKALGRGLSALLTSVNENSSEEVLEIPIRAIQPNASQPRLYFDETSLTELADSIRANGIIQPLLVRRIAPERYEIIAGERRWRAAQIVGLGKVPAVVRDVPDDKILELALIENIQRQELNPIEEAHAYKRLIETLGLTQELVAQRVGKDRTVITNHLRLLRLPQEVQKMLEKDEISMGHARALLGVDDAAIQQRLAQRIAEKRLSVREVERTIKIYAEKGKEPKQKEEAKRPVNDANFRAAEDKLRRHLGTQVKIVQDRSGESGKIEIEYYSNKDLTRIYDLLMARAEREVSAEAL